MTQLDLLAWTPPPPPPPMPPAQRHSRTSIAAAESIRETAGTLRARVLAFIAKQPDGATDEEVQAALDMGGNTERPRRRELQQGGRITDSGRVRPTTSGRNAVVWIAMGKIPAPHQPTD